MEQYIKLIFYELLNLMFDKNQKPNLSLILLSLFTIIETTIVLKIYRILLISC